ncbi:hypothetical protein AMTR_s00003p00270780, partial [Amborella trichopoda]
MYHNTSVSSGPDLIDVSDDINVSFTLGWEYSIVVVHFAATMELVSESLVDGPSSRNNRHNPLPDEDQNIPVAPDTELVPERDMKDIEPLESPCREV